MPRTSALNLIRVIPIAVFLLVALPANAAKLGFGVLGGYGQYTMDDINDRTVTSVNSTLRRGGFPDRMSEIGHGSDFGGGLRLAVSSRVLASFDYEHLAASTSATAGSARVKLATPARVISATLTYLLAPATRFGYGLQAGIGRYTSDATFAVDGVAEPFKDTIHGSGIGYRLGILVNVPAGKSTRFTLSGGWRQAHTTGLEQDGRSLTIDGENATLDWSGVVIQGGLDLFFGRMAE